jgi:hypothetical protein
LHERGRVGAQYRVRAYGRVRGDVRYETGSWVSQAGLWKTVRRYPSGRARNAALASSRVSATPLAASVRRHRVVGARLRKELTMAVAGTTPATIVREVLDDERTVA